MNVVLIGYRGSGKTTVGRLLAGRLKCEFVDTDERIAALAGRSISEIFAGEGEAGFRRRESAAIADAVAVPNRVVSVGGGAVASDTNRAMMRQYGTVIWLRASAEVLWSRIQADPSSVDGRPDLADGGLEEIRTLLARREPLYNQCQHRVFNAETASPAALVEAILRLLETPPKREKE